MDVLHTPTHVRPKHTLGSNPWIFFDPSRANMVVILFTFFVFTLDMILVCLHWRTGYCSRKLKFWIMGKYLAPLLSYLSCCFFVPCNVEETLDVSSAIPYSQHQIRRDRIRDSNPFSQIRSTPSHPSSRPFHPSRPSPPSLRHHDLGEPTPSDDGCCSRCRCWNGLRSVSIPYPYDMFLSEWFISPSTITTNIAESIDNADSVRSFCCKTYIYSLGIIFDRGILELFWLFIGGVSIISEDTSCRAQNPILFYYVVLQMILGLFISSLLILWMVSSSACPLQVARLLTCCYGMECDILGLLPRHLFQQLLTMHHSWTKHNGIGDSATLKDHARPQRMADPLQYEHSVQNYHTLRTIPHHFDEPRLEADAVELATSSNIKVTQICGMCGHHLCGDSRALECGHEFHTLCLQSQRPMNFSCPECETDVEDGSTLNGIDDSDDELDSVHGDDHHSVTTPLRGAGARGGVHPLEANLKLL